MSDEPLYSGTGTQVLVGYDYFTQYSSMNDIETLERSTNNRYNVVDGNVAPTFSTTGGPSNVPGAADNGPYVRFTHQAGGTLFNDTSIEWWNTGISMNPGVIHFWIRSTAGYQWIGPAGNTHKIFDLQASGAPGSERVMLNFGSEPLTPSMAAYGSLTELRPNVSVGLNNYNQNLNYDRVRCGSGGSDIAINDGQWHRITLRYTRSTDRPTATTGDGRCEMWVDGIKVIEYLGDQAGRPEEGLVNMPEVNMFTSPKWPTTRNDNTYGGNVDFGPVMFWRES